MKPILVVSHERSGTHFLINAIAQNFGMETHRWIDAPRVADALEMRSFAEDVSQPNVIRKSHHQASWFCYFNTELFASHHVFYVIRDVRAVMVSCWHYFNETGLDVFPLAKTFDEFMAVNPSEFAFDRDYSMIPCPTWESRWMEHIAGWHHSFDDLTVVTYQELSDKFEATVWKIAQALGRKPNEIIVRPGLDAPSINPRRGLCNGWQDDLTIRQSNVIARNVKRHREWLT